MNSRLLTLLVPLAAVAALCGLPSPDEPAASSTRPARAELEPAKLWIGEADSIDQPALVPLGDDRLLLVFNEFVIGEGDRLVATEFDSASETASELVVVRERPAQILTPCACRTADGVVHVFWTELNEGTPRIATSRREGASWSAPEFVTGARCFRPRCATQGSRLALAYEGWHSPAEGEGRARQEVFVRVHDGKSWAAPRRVSPLEDHDGDPDITALDGGGFAVAWTHVKVEDWDVWGVMLDDAGTPRGPPIDLSRNRWEDDMHVSLAPAEGGGAWVLHDEITDDQRGSSFAGSSGRKAEGALRMLHWSGDTVTRPIFPEGAGPGPSHPLSLSGGRPVLGRAENGGLVLAFRDWLSSREGTEKVADEEVMLFEYPAGVQTLGPEGWSPVHYLGQSSGDHDDLAIGRGPGGAWAVWGGNQLSREGATTLAHRLRGDELRRHEEAGLHIDADLGPYRIGLTRLPASAPVPRSSMNFEDVALDDRPHRPFIPQHTTPEASGEARHEVVDGERRYQVYYGDLHRHTSYSRCSRGREQDSRDRYAMGRDLYGDDFLCLTDHSFAVDAAQWWRQAKWMDAFANPAFCTLQGFEWGGRRSGHMNVIFRARTDLLISSMHDDASAQDGLWEMLDAEQAITIPHHPASAKLTYNWDYYDRGFVRLVEIFQSSRGNYEFADCFRTADDTVDTAYVQDGLSKNYQFGLIASSDHGSEACYAAVLAEGLDRESVFTALRARRTFGCTNKGMFVDFRVDGELMGSSVVLDGPPKISFEVAGTEELVEVVLFRDGEVLWSVGHDGEPLANNRGARRRLKIEPTLGVHRLRQEVEDPEPKTGRAWYYVRGIQADGGVVWSSPVFTRLPRK